MTDKEYNGWTNYETWLVKLWMDNDQGSYEHYKELTREIQSGDNTNRFLPDRDMTVYNLAKAISHEFYDANPIGDDASVWNDLMSAALSEVNWQEIAQSLIDDNPIETDSEEVSI